jgi:hypothetical protein
VATVRARRGYRATSSPRNHPPARVRLIDPYPVHTHAPGKQDSERSSRRLGRGLCLPAGAAWRDWLGDCEGRGPAFRRSRAVLCSYASLKFSSARNVSNSPASARGGRLPNLHLTSVRSGL